MSTPSPYRYRQHLIWPVLDDDTGALDYYDIHHPDDHNGNGDPIAEGLATLAEAKKWIDDYRNEQRWISALDRLGGHR